MLQLDGNRLTGVKKNLIVLTNRLVLVVLNRLADSNHPTGDDGDLVAVGEDDTALGLALVVVLADDHALANRLNDIELAAPLARFGGHPYILAPSNDQRRNGRADQRLSFSISRP